MFALNLIFKKIFKYFFKKRNFKKIPLLYFYNNKMIVMKIVIEYIVSPSA